MAWLWYEHALLVLLGFSSFLVPCKYNLHFIALYITPGARFSLIFAFIYISPDKHNYAGLFEKCFSNATPG